ncbi:MAG TPA: hypothetical protein VGL75_14660 [Acidothermaceae bacterium]
MAGIVSPASAHVAPMATHATVEVPTYSSLGLSMVAAGNDATQYWLYFERSSPAARYAVIVRVSGLALPSNIRWQLPRRSRPSGGPSAQYGGVTVSGDAFFRSAAEVRRIAQGMIGVSLATFRAMAQRGSLDQGELHHVGSTGLPIPITTYLVGGLSGQGVLYTMQFGNALGVSTSIGSDSSTPFHDDCARIAAGIVVGLFTVGPKSLPPDLHVSVAVQGKAVAVGGVALDRRASGLGLFDALLPSKAAGFTVSWGSTSTTLRTHDCLY